MNTQVLEDIVQIMMTAGKGLLAADTSVATTQKRFDAVGVENTKATRGEYREILLTTPYLDRYLNGVILFEETFWQAMQNGTLFREQLKSDNILPGIKVDKGLVDLPGFEGEKVTQGLDGLPEAMATYAGAGAKFAKWRAVITITDDKPTDECIGANTYTLSRYARICQDAGIVPIVELEILFDGNHTIERCEEVMAHTFDILFQTMRAFRVHLPGAILKTAMVLPGKDSGVPMNHNDVAERTTRVLHGHVPHELGGVVFLSGGQTSRDAYINLNRIVQRGPHPWKVTFSYDRALQDKPLHAWAHNRGATMPIQATFAIQLQLAADASRGELDESILGTDEFVSESQN